MKLLLTDVDLNWNSSDDGYIPMELRTLTIENLRNYPFELDLPQNADYDDITEELKYEVSQLTGLTVYSVDCEIIE